VVPGSIPTGITYHQLSWTSVPVSGFGRYELQRFDPLTGAWYTIMNALSPTVTGFADYEARVGVLSSYRIRSCNAYDFCGAWSVEVAGILPGPGVTGSSVNEGVLIFTSNVDPNRSLAYVAAWDGRVTEAYQFLESDDVVFQQMFRRNNRAVFHGSERGGERFTRDVLVQNATVVPTLSERAFQSLRDLGWADLPYVCVRDEFGSRWFAFVQVPDGTFQRYRRLQIAQIVVTETDDTPFAVEVTA
jgi:hypothetical protein